MAMNKTLALEKKLFCFDSIDLWIVRLIVINNLLLFPFNIRFVTNKKKMILKSMLVTEKYLNNSFLNRTFWISEFHISSQNYFVLPKWNEDNNSTKIFKELVWYKDVGIIRSQWKFVTVPFSFFKLCNVGVVGWVLSHLIKMNIRWESSWLVLPSLNVAKCGAIRMWKLLCMWVVLRVYLKQPQSLKRTQIYVCYTWIVSGLQL